MISEGDLVFVNYGEVPPCVHARLVGAHVQNDLYVIITPDDDVYEEQLSNLNPDFTEFHYGGPGLGAAIPPGVNRASLYSFRPLTALEYLGLMNQARVYAAGLRVSLGLPAQAGPAAPPGVPAGAVAPPSTTVWVASETRGNIREGTVVVGQGQPLPAGAIHLGDRGVMLGGDGKHLSIKQIEQSQVQSMEARDLRVLDINFDVQGQRRREFAEAVALMSQDPMPGGDLQLDGPPSSLAVLKAMVDRGLTPVTDHEHWVRTNELPRGDRSVYEMEVITRVLESLVMVDQLNLPNLKGCELLLRRWQLIREAHRISPGAPDYSAADIFMGWQYRRGAGVNPALAKHVADELKDQAAIAKEARKAKEEVDQRRKGRPNPKDKGGGAGGGSA